MRVLSAFMDAFAAALEKWAAEANEYAKKLPEREYWRGYQDGMRDAAAVKQEGVEP